MLLISSKAITPAQSKIVYIASAVTTVECAQKDIQYMSIREECVYLCILVDYLIA